MQLQLALDCRDAAPDEAHVIGERALRERQEHGERAREERADAEVSRNRGVAANQREAAPGEAEPQVGVEATAEELEVVRNDEEQPDGDEEDQPGLERDRAHEADAAGGRNRHGCEPDEHPVGDARAQRTTAQLVERVGSDADGEGEGGDGCTEPSPRDDGSEAAADHDVGEVPGRVRQVQERDVVTPAARLERVPGRPGRRHAHRRRPQMTTPPPRLIRRTARSSMPAADQSSSCRSRG